MNKKNLLLKKLHECFPVEEDLEFDDFNIEEKLQNQLKQELRYWDLHQIELYKLDLLENKMIDMKYIVYDELKFEDERSLTKSEIETFYLPADKRIKELQEKIELQQIKVDYFKLCYNAIKQMKWNIHSYLKNKHKE